MIRKNTASHRIYFSLTSAGHKPLKKYMVTVDSVEKRTDIDFFPALPDEIENRIEAELVQELP